MEDNINLSILELQTLLSSYNLASIAPGQGAYGQTILQQIIGETQEYVKILERVSKYLKNNGNPLLKKGAPGPQRYDNKNTGSAQGSRGSMKPASQPSLSELNQIPIELPPGFKTRIQLEHFVTFFSAYLRRTPRVIELAIRVAYSEGVLFSDTSRLKFFRMRFKKFISQIIQRCYKTVMVLLKLFPESRDPQDESIFDKIYLIQLFLQTLNSKQLAFYDKITKSPEYEQVAKNVLSTGGTKTKSVKEISETSKIIKEKMDSELISILNNFEIKAEFFVSSPSIKKIWQNHFSDYYRVPLDMFIQSFDYYFTKKSYNKDSIILTQERIENLKWVFNFVRDESDPEEKLNFKLLLENIVNITDFIKFSQLLKIFEPDEFDQCIQKLRTETSIGNLYMQDETLSRLSESVNAKYLSRDIEKAHLRTVFVRTSCEIKRHPLDFILLMNLFGMKNIYLEYRDKILHEILQEDLHMMERLKQNDSKLHNNEVISEFKETEEKFQKPLNVQSYLQMNLDAFHEGSITKKYNEMVTMSYMSTFQQNQEEAQALLLDQIKVDKSYQKYDRRDHGYLITFEHENEVNELLNKKHYQTLFQEILNEKDIKVPFFIKFDEINQYAQGKLAGKLFSIQSLNNLDLNQIKEHIMKVKQFNLFNYAQSYQINMFQLWESQKLINRNSEKYLIRKKYFDLYLMVGNISIDGFKRESYILKVRDFSEDIDKAQRQLQEEEHNIETAAQDQIYHDDEADDKYTKRRKSRNFRDVNPLSKARTTISFAENLQNITQLLLKIETLEVSRKRLQEKLTLKQKKWIENDKLFKERRFTLMNVLQQDLALQCDVTKHIYYNESILHKRITQHEKAILMVDQVFALNRVKSQRFLSEIQLIVKDKQDQLFDLKSTFNDLITKDQAIEQEQQQMKKQIEEMIQLGALRRERDQTMIDIQEQELRITQLKKSLGITEKPKSQQRKTSQGGNNATSQSALSNQTRSKQSFAIDKNPKTPNNANVNLGQIQEVQEENKTNGGWERVRSSQTKLKAVASLNRSSPEKMNQQYQDNQDF